MRLRLFVSGEVQGVFFRKNVSEFCSMIGLTGWVKNLDDGRVELVAEGPKEKLDQLLKFLHKNPGASRVDDIDSEFFDQEEGFEYFKIT